MIALEARASLPSSLPLEKMLFLATLLTGAVVANGSPVLGTRASCTTVASGKFSANFYNGPDVPSECSSWSSTSPTDCSQRPLFLSGLTRTTS